MIRCFEDLVLCPKLDKVNAILFDDLLEVAIDDKRDLMASLL